jgi:CBS domain-containing protein
MKKDSTVKDIMIDISYFPHIPYWFTIKQAIGIIKKLFIETEKCIFPRVVVLVFDEKYNLVGTFTPRDIIKGLTPKLKHVMIKDAVIAYIDENALASFGANIFISQAKELAEKPVSEIMIPAKLFVSPEDTALKAAFLMVHHNLVVLPVLEDKKLVGVVRMLEAFDKISNIVLE